MKKTTIIAIVCFTFISLLGYSQTQTQTQTQNKRKSDETRSKKIIRSLNTDIETYLSDGKIEEGAAHIREQKAKCDALTYNTLCNAGIDFMYGYLYQNGANKDSLKKSRYQNKARSYYKKVLKAYPNNAAALNNYILINNELGDKDSNILKLNELADTYPRNRVTYLVKLGDIYKADKDFNKACETYEKAYQEDLFSVKTCEAIVDLYTNDDHWCNNNYSVREFALICEEIELPNLSEELLRRELTKAIEAKDKDKTIKSLILWGYILADNGWVDALPVRRLTNDLAEKGSFENFPELLNGLDELIEILKISDISELYGAGFWYDQFPEVNVERDWEHRAPLHVLIRILRTKGKESLINKDYKKAEGFWIKAKDLSRYFDDGYFTLVAADLAKLYKNQRDLDIHDSKLYNLIEDLFGMKGTSYRQNDLPMIQKYHTTLGAIFYDRKDNWEGGGVETARFQLERALSKRLFGIVVNPKLRQMLGDVYLYQNDKSEAIEAYSHSIHDYLSLDQIKKAKKLHSKLTESLLSDMKASQKEKTKKLNMIIAWREYFVSPENRVLTRQMNVKSQLKEVAQWQDSLSVILPKDFVQRQFFKGLSDLSEKLPEERKVDKLILAAGAIQKIENVKTLSSPSDYYRIKKMTLILEERYKEEEQQLKYAQYNNKAGINDSPYSKKAGYRSYEIPSLEKQIFIPEQLFELNQTILSSYESTENWDYLVDIKLNKGKFEKVDKNN